MRNVGDKVLTNPFQATKIADVVNGEEYAVRFATPCLSDAHSLLGIAKIELRPLGGALAGRAEDKLFEFVTERHGKNSSPLRIGKTEEHGGPAISVAHVGLGVANEDGDVKAVREGVDGGSLAL